MLPDRVSNPGPLTYESGALPIALRAPALPEKSGHLKINGYGSQTSENLFILFKRGKMYFLMRKSKPISLLIGGYS